MSQSAGTGAPLSPAARAFSTLTEQGDWMPAPASPAKRFSAVLLAMMVLASAPLFWAANAIGLAGDLPVAVAASGPGHSGSGDDDDDNSGPGSGDDDDDDSGQSNVRTDDTSRAGHSTRGTTRDNDTNTNTGTRVNTAGTNTGTRTGH